MSSAPAGSRSSPALVRMLDDVVAWRERTGRDRDATLEAIAAEERLARRDLDEAQRRHAALLVLRREEEERLAALEDEALRRKRSSVRDALVLDRSLLEERAAAVAAAVAEREAGVLARMAEPAMQPALYAWLRAQEEVAAMGGDEDPACRLPAPVLARLAPLLEAARAPLPSLGAPSAGVGVLVSADPPVGSPEALVMVLPVPWAVYAEGTARAEDLCTLLAYRLVGAVYEVLGTLGAAHAPVRFADLQGSLMIQVWLGDHALEEDLRERVLEGIGAAVEGTDELVAAGVEVYAVWLTPDLLAEALT